MKKVTIQDVAKELNLSRNTVASALNNSETVAYETRYMVLKKACDMGYLKLSPHVLSEFKLKKNIHEYKTLIVVVKRELCVFWNSIIMGIADEAAKCGCKVRLNFVSDQDEQDLVLPLDFSDPVDGVILMSVFTDAYNKLISKQMFPMVTLDGPIRSYGEGFGCDMIVCEGKNSIRAITQDMIVKGARKIGFIGDITYCESVKQRYEGFIEAHRIEEIPVDETIIISSHVPNRYYRREEVEEALEKLSEIPEAFVCANDDIALDTIRFLKKKGYKVPEDVMVSGFDNIEELTQVEQILTTVNVRNHMIGKRLVDQLLWRLDNPDFPREVISIETDPIFRKSTQK